MASNLNQFRFSITHTHTLISIYILNVLGGMIRRIHISYLSIHPPSEILFRIRCIHNSHSSVFIFIFVIFMRRWNVGRVSHIGLDERMDDVVEE